MIEVSIVIVCMNNLKNLYPCLESIRKYTTGVTYETLVVAYLFSSDNLDKVKRDFPWVTFIESNEIRGFSENNNVALRKAKGKYCFVLNDDTEMNMPVVDYLVKSIKVLPDNVAVLSPVTVFPNGDIQVCGRPPINWWNNIIFIKNIYNRFISPKYCNKDGVFKSYNIIGAAFLIKRDIFEKFGWFDERYFFCPEDIALSTALNKAKYSCYVDSSIKVIHKEGMSGKTTSLLKTATKPAGDMGTLIYYSNNNRIKRVLFALLFLVENSLKYIYHLCKCVFGIEPIYNKILMISEKNTISTIMTSLTPKEIFMKYYLNLKEGTMG